jgi:hypothetical protein
MAKLKPEANGNSLLASNDLGLIYMFPIERVHLVDSLIHKERTLLSPAMREENHIYVLHRLEQY